MINARLSRQVDATKSRIVNIGSSNIHQSRLRLKASELSLPILPFAPTANGSDRAFQLLSASGASDTEGFRACQLRPSLVEASVPFGPAAIQVLEGADQATALR